MSEEARSAIVTGAGSGIGRAIALALARDGYEVHLLDIGEEGLAETQSAAATGTVVSHLADVSRYGEVEDVVEEASRRRGRLDLMVNAAGVYDGYAGIGATSPDLWRRVIEVNLGGAFNGCTAAAARMPASAGGRILSIGSVGAARGAADGLAYCASKAGLEGMNRRLAVDVARRGITANVIAPGATDTAIRETSRSLVGHLYPDEPVQHPMVPEVLDWLIPAGRPAAPEEVADLALFLASDKAAYITGQVIRIDGGWTAQ